MPGPIRYSHYIIGSAKTNLDLEEFVNEDDALFAGGAMVAAGSLAALHYFPWWRKLRRTDAYIVGTLAVLLGQGVYLRFSRQWFRLCLIAIAGGTAVLGAYEHDRRRRKRANALANGI